jgi:protein deglycase
MAVKKVLLLLANGFETYEASAFIDVMGWNLIDGDHTTRLYSCGLTREVKSSFDQKVVVDYLIDEISVEEYDALAIPGGFEKCGFYQDAYDPVFLELIRRFHSHNKMIATICVAALALGKSGLLTGKPATTYNMDEGLRQKTLAGFGAQVINQPIVNENLLITSWNPATAMDVAFLLLETLTSPVNTNHIKKIMGFC